MPRVITIDGPSGSGKGTISQLLAARLGWRLLDSGALYRVLGLAIEKKGIACEQTAEVAAIADAMKIDFRGRRVLLEGEDVTDQIRTEKAGNAASKVAAIPEVRQALLGWQRHYAREPGLVADGRDMGTVVFPDAELKVFLTASAEERAKRRYKQLKEKGLDVNVPSLAEEIRQRDERDRNRSVAPLVAAEGAMEVDSTALSINEVLELVLKKAHTIFQDSAV